jgi:hypothetical protein
MSLTQEESDLWTKIKDHWEQANKAELERWGNPISSVSPYDIQALQSDLFDGRKAKRIWRVLDQLAQKGMVAVNHTLHHDSQLKRHAFGRGYHAKGRTIVSTTIKVVNK